MTVHVGLCGAGIGGLAAAIAIVRGGAQVTVLEAADELGEIGAGIQMTPNVARLIRRWGVDKVIGDNLMRHEEFNLRRKDGTKIGGSRTSKVEAAVGQPWWLVHRHHLHQGLVEVARRNGCVIHIGSRVADIDYSKKEVIVRTTKDKEYRFDLLVGSDGVGSVTRQTLFPNVKPAPPTNDAAYRAIVPTAKILADPVGRELLQKRTVEVWLATNSYIISYQISNGRDYNMVLNHAADHPVTEVEDVDIREVREYYKDWDPRIKRAIDMVPSVQRWPLLVTGPLESWSSPQKNVVLMGDAAHSMVNHMAQGAATSMEDGAFLGKCLGEVVRGRLSIAEAVGVYEQARMPLAHKKQQVSFLNGEIWHLPDGPAQEARDRAMEAELKGEQILRTPNLHVDPITVWEIYSYDAEQHAEEELQQWFNKGKKPMDARTKVTRCEASKYVGWFLPEGEGLQHGPKL